MQFCLEPASFTGQSTAMGGETLSEAELLREGVARRIEMSELYRDLLISSITESLKSALHGVLTMIDNHNTQAPPGKYASRQSIIQCFQRTAEETEGDINDAFADLIVDLQRAVEEYDDDKVQGESE